MLYILCLFPYSIYCLWYYAGEPLDYWSITTECETLKEIVVIERYNSLSTIAVSVRCGLPGQIMIVVYAVTPRRRMVCLNHLRGALITDILLCSIRVIEYNDGREIVSLIKTMSSSNHR